jgi:hypothetical protein
LPVNREVGVRLGIGHGYSRNNTAGTAVFSEQFSQGRNKCLAYPKQAKIWLKELFFCSPYHPSKINLNEAVSCSLPISGPDLPEFLRTIFKSVLRNLKKIVRFTGKLLCPKTQNGS